MNRAFVKLGQFLTRQRLRMAIPGRCSQWGCLVPVGNGSEFGDGPVCMICEQRLRHVGLEEEEVERWKRTTESH